MKRLLMTMTGLAVLVLAAVAVTGAVSSAQEGDTLVGSFLGRVAEKLGVSEDDLNTAIDEARDETIDEAVADGRLTEEQGERLKDSPFPFAAPHPRGCGKLIDAAAEVLGMTEEDLAAELRDGNSLADVAEAQGMSVEDFTSALLAQVQTQLDEAVAGGDITQEQADDVYSHIEENIDDIVNAEHDGGGPWGPRHGPRGPGFGPLFDDAPETEQSSDVTA